MAAPIKYVRELRICKNIIFSHKTFYVIIHEKKNYSVIFYQIADKYLVPRKEPARFKICMVKSTAQMLDCWTGVTLGHLS